MKKEFEEIDLEALSANDYESPFEFTHYGPGYGKRFEHPLYSEYLEKSDKGLIIIEWEMTEKETNDILETLKLSLENGKDFYTNAKPYMKEEMEGYNKLLEEETLF